MPCDNYPIQLAPTPNWLSLYLVLLRLFPDSSDSAQDLREIWNEQYYG